MSVKKLLLGVLLGGIGGLAIGVLSGNGTRAQLAPLADIIVDSIADLPALFGASDRR